MSEGFEGGCLCGRLRFRLKTDPIAVNCCHCRDCRRRSGSAFAVNAMIEATRIEQVGGAWNAADQLGTAVGSRQWRCAECGVLLFTDHRLFGDAMRFVRVGALDEGWRLPPDTHFFTRDKFPWVTIPADMARFETLPDNLEGLDLSADARDRMQQAMAAQPAP